jgi:hypothetical protein
VGDEQSGESVSHRPPSRIAHRRSGNRSRGEGDQVASRSTRKGNVIVVETSEDSACQSAYYSARESRSGSPVESRRRLVRHSAQGSGVSSSEGGGRSSSHRSRGGGVESSGEGRRHLEHYSDPGEGRSHSTRHSDPGPGGYKSYGMQEPDRGWGRLSQGTPQGHRVSPSHDPHPRATPEGGPSHFSGRACKFPVDPIPEDRSPADYSQSPWEGEGSDSDHHRAAPSAGRRSSLRRPHGTPRPADTRDHLELDSYRDTPDRGFREGEGRAVGTRRQIGNPNPHAFTPEQPAPGTPTLPTPPPPYVEGGGYPPAPGAARLGTRTYGTTESPAGNNFCINS